MDDRGRREERLNPNLWRRLDEPELSERTATSLARENIRYIGELVHKTQDELLRLKGFGREALREVRFLLAEMSLDVGFEDMGGWTPPIEEAAASPLGRARVVPVAPLEWDEVPASESGGRDWVRIFIRRAFAPTFATLLRRVSRCRTEVPDGRGSTLVLDGGGFEDDFYFDDADQLVIALRDGTIERVASACSRSGTIRRRALPGVLCVGNIRATRTGRSSS